MAAQEQSLDFQKNAPVEEAQERPTTSSSKESNEIDAEKQAASDAMPPVEPVQSTAESIYPSQSQTIAVMVSLMLAVFIIAFVCCLIARNE